MVVMNQVENAVGDNDVDAAVAALARIADAMEMARPVVFLASDAASYMTGRSIIVDGGWTKDLA